MAVERPGVTTTYTSQMDIINWVGLHPRFCPNCGIVWKELPLEANLIPHWKGTCKEEPNALNN